MGETFSALIIWTASKFSVTLWRPAARAPLRACSHATHKLTNVYCRCLCIIFKWCVYILYLSLKTSHQKSLCRYGKQMNIFYVRVSITVVDFKNSPNMYALRTHSPRSVEPSPLVERFPLTRCQDLLFFLCFRWN